MPYNPNKMPTAAETQAEQESSAERPKKRASTEGQESSTARAIKEQEDRANKQKIEELQKLLGIKKLKDPEAMLYAVIDRGEVSMEQIQQTADFLEARQIQLQQELLTETNESKKAALKAKIEANSSLIFKLEDARNAIKEAGAQNNPEQAARILDKVLVRDKDIAKGADKAIRSLEREQAQLESELESVYQEITARESGAKKDPGFMQRMSLGLGNLMRRISSQQELAQTPQTMSSRELTFKRREIQQRLNQLEMDLINLRPAKQARPETTWTAPIEEGATELGEEDIITDEELEQQAEAKKKAVARMPKPKQHEAEAPVDMSAVMRPEELPEATDETSGVRRKAIELPKPKAVEKADERWTYEEVKSPRMPKPRAHGAEAPVDMAEVMLPRPYEEESEEVSGVRRKAIEMPKPRKYAKDERASVADVLRQEQAENEAREKAEFQKKVAWAEKLLPGGQAAAINQDVLGQMGVNWGSANEQQRQFSVDYVFKAAAVQEALNSGNDEAYNRAKQDLQKFEKTLEETLTSPYFEPSGRAGIGVTLESGRAEQGRAASRMAGGQEAARGRLKARRAVNESPVIQGVSAQAVEAEEERRKAEQEERLMSGARAAQEIVDREENRTESVKRSAKEAMAKARIPEPPAELRLQAEIGKRMMSPMTIERTAALVPKAEELWNLVNEQLAKKPKAEKALKSIKDGNESNPATLYVMAMGRYLEAAKEPAPTEIINALAQRIMDANSALGIEGNALVQSVMAERGKKYGKAVGRNLPRGKETTAQQARRTARI